ncbi:hypothetical protein [Sphingomonas sp. BK235]|uniref:hypothetical protein n=1 Tax=Sphingomonas sp. BK235 TaxID=2512131 RepID=UPI0010521EEC|nr:hypothetical protein [Sphingomonas sp. BK235]TCP33282.1 hypothetical protein EV292_106224 [Sphingomonas sp. BK235]
MALDQDLLDKVSALLGRRDLTQQEFSAWWAGAADGGLAGDGLFPATDSAGFVRSLPSPAKVLELARGGALPGGSATIANYLRDRKLKNDTPGLQAALDAFMLDDVVNTLVFDDGVYSPHWSGVIPNGKRKRLVGTHNAILYATTRAQLITCVANEIWWDRITAIGAVKVLLSKDPTFQTEGTVSVITMASPHPVKAGQQVKIYANDPIPNQKTADGAGTRHEGEDAVVGKDNTDDPTKIILTAPLRGSYTMNPRIALMPDAALEIHGFTVSCDTPLLTGPGAGVRGAVQLIQMAQPEVIGLRCRQFFGPLVWLVSNRQPVVDRLHFERSPTIPTSGNWPYGVNDTCNTGLRLSNGSFMDIRHPNDAGGYSCFDDDPAPWKYGSARDGIVSQCVALGCSNGFGVHDEVDGYIFEACIAANFYAGASSGGPAYSPRGTNIKIRNCMDFNCRQGIAFSCYGPGNEVSGHHSERAQVSSLATSSPTANDPATFELTIRDSYFSHRPVESGSATIYLAQDYDSHVRFGDNVTFAVEGETDHRRVFSYTRATITGRGPTIDLTKVRQPQDQVRYAGVAAGGRGYRVGDLLTPQGGTWSRTAKVQVTSVSAAGEVQRVDVSDVGAYTALPQGIAATTGGSGRGCTVTVSGGQGATIFWHQDYKPSSVRFDRGAGVKVIAGPTYVKDLWGGAVDDNNTPFAAAVHEFPDTFYEGIHNLGGAHGYNPAGLYAERFPNLKHSIRKLVFGEETGSYYMEISYNSATPSLPVANLLDRKITMRIQGTNYDGTVLTPIDKTKVPGDFELVVVNATAGRITSDNIVIPAGEALTVRYSSLDSTMAVAKTWSTPFRLAGARSNTYTVTGAHIGGLQAVRMVDGNRTITLPKGRLTEYDAAGNVVVSALNVRVGDRVYFEQRNANSWGFLTENGDLIDPDGAASAFTRSGGPGTSCYAECVSNVDGVSARWTIGGTVAP